MCIPSGLAETLAGNRRLGAAVDIVAADFEDWIGDSKGGPFFPEYTDHGMRHIRGVLRTADALMTDESRDLLGAEDAAALILAVLLHDCVMHLKEDGFRALIEQDCPWRPMDGFPDRPWHELWTEFASEATRWDDRKRVDVLGDDSEPVNWQALDKAAASGKLSDEHKPLIGEFLRRHHHTLAHQIAIHGVPGPGDDRIRIEGVSAEIADIAGVIARSHGLPMRSCYDYLSHKHGHRRRPRGVLAVYHMALVRVADYLQVGAERAPKAALQVQALRSPISRREWALHGLDMDIRTENDDPELLWITAIPGDVELYLRLKGLLAGIQSELDASWAALGEVYGGEQRLKALGLTIRRVRSNIDDPDEFVRNQ